MTKTIPSRMAEGLLDALAAGEPSWLRERRQQAWRLQQELPLPDRALHRWRYTDPERLLPGAETLVRPMQARPAAEPAPDTDGQTPLVMDLARAVRSESARLEPLLGSVVPAADSPFTAAHAALWSSGLYIEVPAGLDCELPLRQILDLSGAEGLLLPRMLVVLREGARLTLVDEVTSSDREAPPMVHRVIEAVLERGSRLEMLALQTAPESATLHTVLGARLDQQARIDLVFAAFGGGLVKTDLAVDLKGRGAEADIAGVVLGHGRQRFDHHAVQRLHAADCRSSLDLRTVLTDRAQSAATGLLWIGPDGARGQAVQENRNLLLSDRAKAISLPELEILTDDVQAKHGATMGPVDEELLYYMLSRGLPREQAVRLVVRGFLEPLIERAPAGGSRERLRELVAARLRE